MLQDIVLFVTHLGYEVALKKNWREPMNPLVRTALIIVAVLVGIGLLTGVYFAGRANPTPTPAPAQTDVQAAVYNPSAADYKACQDQGKVLKHSNVEFWCEPAPAIDKPTPDAPAATSPTSCTGWDKGQTHDLNPGQSVLGDVVVVWPGYREAIAAYDRGNGEGTVIINKSTSSKASVFAEWGAGCSKSTDGKALADAELAHGCGAIDGCNSVRIVTLTDNGTSVEFFRK